MGESEIGYRGSKSVISETITVKEQRVNGSWHVLTCLRCTLTGFERNCRIKILSNRINQNIRYTSTLGIVKQQQQGGVNPWFVTGELRELR